MSRLRSPEVLTNGMIFEFKNLEQAKAFQAAVMKYFNLNGRVFDNKEAAERAHQSPFQQDPPVVHIDRPFWFLPKKAPQKAWDRAWKIESQIEQLALRFGGTFTGT
jgi:hypothetical protein